MERRGPKRRIFLLVFLPLVLVASSPQGRDATVQWERRIEVASGEAHRGAWRMNESDFRWVDDPTVHIGGNGDVAVAWVDQAQKDVFFQVYGKDGRARFSSPSNVSKSPDTFSWLPRIAVAPGRPTRIYVLWQEIVFSGGTHGGEIFYAWSADGGQTFGQPANLSGSAAGDGKGRLDRDTWDNGSLELARAASGELFVAWTEYEGTLWLRRSEDGTHFSSPLRIGGTPAAPARAPSIAVASNGVIHVAWAVGEIPSADIHLTTSTDGGRSFGVARTVCESTGHSDAPKIAVDQNETLHLAYAEAVDKGTLRYQVRYSRLEKGATRFEASRAVAGFEGDTASARFPQLAVNGEGRVYLLWEHYTNAYVRATGLAFTHSPNGGDSFRSASLATEISSPALGFNGSQQGSLTTKLAVGKGGDIVIVNSTFQPGMTSHVWLLRGRA